MSCRSTSISDSSNFYLTVSSQNDSFDETKFITYASVVIQSSGVGDSSCHQPLSALNIVEKKISVARSNHENCLENLMPQLSLNDCSQSSLRSTITSKKIS